MSATSSKPNCFSRPLQEGSVSRSRILWAMPRSARLWKNVINNTGIGSLTIGMVDSEIALGGSAGGTLAKVSGRTDAAPTVKGPGIGIAISTTGTPTARALLAVVVHELIHANIKLDPPPFRQFKKVVTDPPHDPVLQGPLKEQYEAWSLSGPAFGLAGDPNLLTPALKAHLERNYPVIGPGQFGDLSIGGQEIADGVAGRVILDPKRPVAPPVNGPKG